MDFVYWIILIVLIVGVVWWLLNRRRSSDVNGSAPVRSDAGLAGGNAAASAEAAGTAGLPSAAGFGRAAESAPPTTADEAAAQREPVVPAEPVAAGEQTGSTGSTGSTEQGGGSKNVGRPANDGEWETQWSEASGSSAVGAGERPVPDGPAGTAAAPEPAPAGSSLEGTGYVHHPEYTAPHSPTLPGAETAAAETEAAEAEAGSGAPAAASHRIPEAEVSEPVVAAEPSAPTDNQVVPEPSGHLAADQPYGAGSASSGPDGTGPADFPVKGDAGTMVYYEEGHRDYEQAKADVWFESAAHAEAAGFRAPRRTRA